MAGDIVDYDENEYELRESRPCPNYCWDGMISVCCDDLCQGESGCIHGDGNRVCPTCKGEGVV